MRSLWNEIDRKNLLVRIDKLAPNAKPRWGRMSAGQTLAHLADWMRVLTGDLKVKNKNTPFRFPVIKHLIIYVAPFPKNVPTAPELLKADPVEWTDEMRDLKELIQRAPAKRDDPNAMWPDHPAFGRMSVRAWGVLGYRHTDHHLRQFGV